MFPLADSGKEIASFQEIMHMIVTAAVVLLSIVSLVCLIIAGLKKSGIIRRISPFACNISAMKPIIATTFQRRFALVLYFT